MSSEDPLIPVEIVITILASPCPSKPQYQTTCAASVRVGDQTIACRTAPIREFISAEWLTNYEWLDVWLGKFDHRHQMIGVNLKPGMRALRDLIKRQARERTRAAKPPKLPPSSPSSV